MEPQAQQTGAVTATQFVAALAPFRLSAGARIAVAVSGGADSMALVRLLAAWSSERQINVFALTVDHQLRDAAAVEAVQVGGWLLACGIPHEILRWDEGPSARLLTRSAQSAAREARYRLMTDWCAAHDYSHLFVAHHADDQVETFLLRLARGSGVDGLAAMAPQTVRDGVVIARPLLGFAKAQLVATCAALEQNFLEDPSNQNPASARVRFRAAQALLEREGLTRERLLATIGHLQRARAALDHAVRNLLDLGSWDDFGVARLPIAAILAAPEEIALRALSRTLMAVSGAEFGPRFEKLAGLYARLTTAPWADATLHGCLVSREGTAVVFAREAAPIDDEKTLSASHPIVWDGRFKLSLSAPVGMTFQVRRTAEGGAMPEAVRLLLAAVPNRLRGTIPALWDSIGVAVVPHVGYVREDMAAIAGFRIAMTSVFAGGAKL